MAKQQTHHLTLSLLWLTPLTALLMICYLMIMLIPNSCLLQSYIDDPVGEFFVALLPMLWDDVDLEFYPYFGDGYDPVWSAV